MRAVAFSAIFEGERCSLYLNFINQPYKIESRWTVSRVLAEVLLNREGLAQKNKSEAALRVVQILCRMYRLQ